MVKVAELSTFDASDYLDSEETITAYLNAILEENGDALLVSALGDIAKARGMIQIAKDAGISRESLYKALPGRAWCTRGQVTCKRGRTFFHSAAIHSEPQSTDHQPIKR